MGELGTKAIPVSNSLSSLGFTSHRPTNTNPTVAVAATCVWVFKHCPLSLGLPNPENNAWVGVELRHMELRIMHLISTLKESTVESGAGLAQFWCLQ